MHFRSSPNNLLVSKKSDVLSLHVGERAHDRAQTRHAALQRGPALGVVLARGGLNFLSQKLILAAALLLGWHGLATQQIVC